MKEPLVFVLVFDGWIMLGWHLAAAIAATCLWMANRSARRQLKQFKRIEDALAKVEQTESAARDTIQKLSTPTENPQ